MITALEVYDSYPGSALLPIRTPNDDEGIPEFLDQMEDSHGDTLFLFVLRELSDCGEDRQECIRRLDTAIHDLVSVLAAIEKGVGI